MTNIFSAQHYRLHNSHYTNTQRKLTHRTWLLLMTFTPAVDLAVAVPVKPL